MKISILDDYHDTLPSRQIYGTFSLSVTSRSVRGRVVGKLHIGITSGLPVIRPEPSRRVRDHLHFATFRRYPLLPIVVGTSTRFRLDRRSTKLGWSKWMCSLLVASTPNAKASNSTISISDAQFRMIFFESSREVSCQVKKVPSVRQKDGHRWLNSERDASALATSIGVPPPATPDTASEPLW